MALRDIFSIGFITLMLSALFYTLIVDLYGIGTPVRDSYTAAQKKLLAGSKAVRRNVFVVSSVAALGLALLTNSCF